MNFFNDQNVAEDLKITL